MSQKTKLFLLTISLDKYSRMEYNNHKASVLFPDALHSKGELIMKKRILTALGSLLLACALCFSLAACGGTDEGGKGACVHVDKNDDGKCDTCEVAFTDGCDAEHRDANDDSKCDECGKNFSDGCDVHFDSNDAGFVCDSEGCFAIVEPNCEHIDANDDSKCDECGFGYSDGCDNHTDGTDEDFVCDTEGCDEIVEPDCEHRDADDDCLCDKCDFDYFDGVEYTFTVYDFEDMSLGINNLLDDGSTLLINLPDGITMPRNRIPNGENTLKENVWGIKNYEGSKRLWLRGLGNDKKHIGQNGGARHAHFDVEYETISTTPTKYVWGADLYFESFDSEQNGLEILFNGTTNGSYLVAPSVAASGYTYMAFLKSGSDEYFPDIKLKGASNKVIGSVYETISIAVEYIPKTGKINTYIDGESVDSQTATKNFSIKNLRIEIPTSAKLEVYIDNMFFVYADDGFTIPVSKYCDFHYDFDEDGLCDECNEPCDNEALFPELDEDCMHTDGDLDGLCDFCGGIYYQIPETNISGATVYDFEDVDEGYCKLDPSDETNKTVIAFPLYDGGIEMVRPLSGSTNNRLKAGSYGVTDYEGDMKLHVKSTATNDVNGAGRNPRFHIFPDMLDYDANYFVLEMDVTVISQAAAAPAFMFYSEGDQDNAGGDHFLLYNVDDVLYFAYDNAEIIYPEIIESPAAYVDFEFNVRFEYAVESGLMSIYVYDSLVLSYQLEPGLYMTHSELQFTTDVTAEWYVDNVRCAHVYADEYTSPECEEHFDLDGDGLCDWCGEACDSYDIFDYIIIEDMEGEAQESEALTTDNPVDLITLPSGVKTEFPLGKTNSTGNTTTEIITDDYGNKLLHLYSPGRVGGDSDRSPSVYIPLPGEPVEGADMFVFGMQICVSDKLLADKGALTVAKNPIQFIFYHDGGSYIQFETVTDNGKLYIVGKDENGADTKTLLGKWNESFSLTFVFYGGMLTVASNEIIQGAYAYSHSASDSNAISEITAIEYMALASYNQSGQIDITVDNVVTFADNSEGYLE